MNYNIGVRFVFAALFLLARPAASADKKDVDASANKTTVELVEYFLKVPTAEANPALIEPFLAVNADSLPKKLRGKAAAKQVEISALIRLHDTKKMGSIIQEKVDCSAKDFVKPLSMAGYFGGYEEVTENELKYVSDKTKCTEEDLGCRFSLLIFYEKKKDRILKFNPNDPIMAIVAEVRNKGGSTNFFGSGFSCMH